MSVSEGSKLKRTPLSQQHSALGARMVEFAGWLLPLQFSGILEEHRATRTAAGLFDVTHLGRLEVSGPDACLFLNKLLPANMPHLRVGAGRYSFLLNERGGVIDDLFIYRLKESEFLLIVNAARVERDLDWIRSQCSSFSPRVRDITEATAMLAVQGPVSAVVVEKVLCGAADMRRNRFAHMGDAFVARTGYTGEDGFEVWLPARAASSLWQQFLETGMPLGLKPAGLGARDLLRLEMGYPLYGQDLGEEKSPLAARLEWALDLDKPDFLGRQALLEEQKRGSEMLLVGLLGRSRAVPRPPADVLCSGRKAGYLTSGGYSPVLQRGIAMGYVDRGSASIGTQVEIVVRGRPQAAEVVRLPFIRRGSRL
jgi:aminomethyltransferase